MNSKPVEALPEVEEDLAAAVAHYLTWRSDGLDYLLDRYDETVGWIAWNPDMFPRKVGRIQRAIIKQSYFLIYFLQEESRTVVLAVLDGRMAPKQIRSRLKARGQRRSRKPPSQ